MSWRSITDLIRRDAPVLTVATDVATAVRTVLAHDLPALPVVDRDERYAGIFGEREFIGALFPQYLQSLGYAGFVPRPIEDVFEKRRECAWEPVGEHMTTDHVDVPADASDVQIAETFLHHRVLLLPVTHDGYVRGVILRREFMRALAEGFLGTLD